MGTRRRRRDDSGAAAVEFALIMPILLVLVFGIIQYGFYFYAMQSGTSATGDALRRLSVGACQTQSERDALIASSLGGALQGAISADTVVYKTTAGVVSNTPVQGGSVTLTLTYPTLNLKFPFIPVPDGGSITRVQTARVEATSPAAGTTCS